MLSLQQCSIVLRIISGKQDHQHTTITAPRTVIDAIFDVPSVAPSSR
jgi:hypothetical protein